MNEKVQVFLFGSFELNINDQTIHLSTRKMEALPRFRQIGNYIAIVGSASTGQARKGQLNL